LTQGKRLEKEIAILMADLTGYTAMTDIHGGASAARIVGKYLEIVDSSIHGSAKLQQRVGDQVVITADNANDLLLTVRKLNTLTRKEHQFLSVHAGLHFGNIFIENENLFGSTINIAARIMNVACTGQILGSSNFVDQLSSYTHSFRSIGVHKFKNLMTSIELFELVHSSSSTSPVDPVCHMHIDATKQSPSTNHNGITYHFCSDHCKSLFLKSPNEFRGPDPEM
jgi:adenylate cyclase